MIQTFWKKNEREEKIQKRAQEKVEQEQRKQDIELIEENIINSGLQIFLLKINFIKFSTFRRN